ncbi:MAG: ABC transporter ATP-binding protein, partial [Betaproteobacteria bacterium]
NDTIAGLKQFRGGQALQIGLRNPPPVEDIARIAGVASVDALNVHLFRVHPRDTADPTDDLVRAAVEREWGLFQLQPAQASLEEVFVQLTHRDEEESA